MMPTGARAAPIGRRGFHDTRKSGGEVTVTVTAVRRDAE
jgi:hypothetical protein